MQFIQNYKRAEGEEFIWETFVFIPVEPSNFLSVTYQVGIRKEGEEQMFKAMVIEMPFLSEHPEKIPLEKLRRIKQTKTEEHYETEEIVKINRPTMYHIEQDMIEGILTWIKSGVINK